MAINSIAPVAGAASYKPPVRAAEKEPKKDGTEAVQSERKSLQAPVAEAPPPSAAAAAPKKEEALESSEPKSEPKPEYVEFQSAAAAPAPPKRDSAVQSYAKNQNGVEEPQKKIDSAV